MKITTTVYPDAAEIVIDDRHTVTVTRFPETLVLYCQDWTGLPAMVWLENAVGQPDLPRKKQVARDWKDRLRLREIRRKMVERGYVNE